MEARTAHRTVRKFGTLLGACVAAIALFAAAAPAAGALQLGVYMRGAPGDAQTLDEYTSLVGQRPGIVMWYRGLDQSLMYSSEIKNLQERGATPMVSLEPVDENGTDIPLADIAAGRYDSYLHNAATVAKNWSGRLMIRFAYEMNLAPQSGIPWGGGPGAYSGNTAADYIAAWRHAVGLFRADGASNAEWVWAPNVDDGGIPFTKYFPGDSWVDQVGLDGYNWGSEFTSTGHSWLSLGETFGPSYKTITELSAKPVIITETASAEAGGSKATWIEQGFLNEIPKQLPRVTAAIWFNVKKETDWRVNSSQESLEAFRRVASSSLFGGPNPDQSPEEPSEGSVEPPEVEEVEVTKRIHSHKGKGRGRKAAQKRSLKRARTSRAAPARRHRGIIRYRLSRAARVSVRFYRRGWRGYVTLRRRGHAGRNTVRFSTKLHGHKLRPSRYRVVVSAMADGRRSNRRRASFRVIRR